MLWERSLGTEERCEVSYAWSTPTEPYETSCFFRKGSVDLSDLEICTSVAVDCSLCEVLCRVERITKLSAPNGLCNVIFCALIVVSVDVEDILDSNLVLRFDEARPVAVCVFFLWIEVESRIKRHHCNPFSSCGVWSVWIWCECEARNEVALSVPKAVLNGEFLDSRSILVVVWIVFNEEVDSCSVCCYEDGVIWNSCCNPDVSAVDFKYPCFVTITDIDTLS